jgi:hypothetical protein
MIDPIWPRKTRIASFTSVILSWASEPSVWNCSRKPWTVRVVKLTMRPIETGPVSPMPPVMLAVPLHVSVSVVTDKQVTIAVRAMTRVVILVLPPPTLRERRHRGLARRLIAVRRRAVLVMSEGQSPHPRRADGRRIGLEDAPYHNALREHVVVFVVPLAGGLAGRCAFEDQIVFVHLSSWLRHRRFLLPHSSSSSRFTAGAFEFFILSQSGERPER